MKKGVLVKLTDDFMLLFSSKHREFHSRYFIVEEFLEDKSFIITVVNYRGDTVDFPVFKKEYIVLKDFSFGKVSLKGLI